MAKTQIKTLEKTYDGIIIGAGHHGLILGSYRAGLEALEQHVKKAKAA